MSSLHLFLFSIAAILIPLKATFFDEDTDQIKWSHIAKLPSPASGEKQLGVAGVFAGISHNVLLIAGGSNFADGAKPWQGGKKIYKDDIYVLARGAGNKFTWLSTETKHLPEKLAYGASTTIAKGIVCAGGENKLGNSSANVFLMSWNAKAGKVQFKHLPSLPLPLANSCMSSIGNKVYLFGGESKDIPSSACFMLDLGLNDTKWQSLPPLPVAMSHSVAVTQSNGQHPCLYVIGGRSGNPSGISTLHNCAFCLDPKLNKWITLSAVGDGLSTTTISAGTGTAYGKTQILLIGGDKGNIFHQIETYNALIAHARDGKEKTKLQGEKLLLLNHHKGFSKDIYLYNTLTNSWKKFGELPFYSQVTTTAVKWDGDIIIPCGEIKPGTRSPDITMGVFEAGK